MRKDKRVTIIIDESVYRRIIKTQARIIRKTSRSCSFSETVGIVVKHGLKRIKKSRIKKSRR